MDVTEYQYTTKQAFLDATIQVLGKSVLTEPLKLQTFAVTASAVDGEQGKTRTAVELVSIAPFRRLQLLQTWESMPKNRL